MAKKYGSNKAKLEAGLRSLLEVAYTQRLRPGEVTRDQWTKQRKPGGIAKGTLGKAVQWAVLQEKAELCLPSRVGENFSWPDGFSLEEALEEVWHVVYSSPRKIKVKPQLTEKASPVEIFSRDEVIKDLRCENRELLHEIETLQAKVELVDILQASSKSMPVLVDRVRTRRGKRQAVAKVICSDLHYEERVRPEQVNYCNEYSPLIAKARMEKLAEGVVWKIQTHRTGCDITQLVVTFGGDMITGYLHLDNLISNYMSPFEAVLECKDVLIQFLLTVLNEAKLERIDVNCVCGNHGRNTERMIHKDMVKNSFEWIMYHFMAQQLAHEERIKFNIAQGGHLYTRLYDYVHRDLHGTEIGYQGGIGGITIPLNKAVKDWNALIHADVSYMGHFHTFLAHPHAILNGSVCGFTEYAQNRKCPFQEPQQAFTIVDSHRGLRDVTPLWVDKVWDHSIREKRAGM